MAKTPQIDFNNDTKQFMDLNTGEVISQISMRVVTTVHEPLLIGGGAHSIGEIIDGMVRNAARNNDDVESISVDLLPSDWSAIRDAIKRDDDYASA